MHITDKVGRYGCASWTGDQAGKRKEVRGVALWAAQVDFCFIVVERKNVRW